MAWWQLGRNRREPVADAAPAPPLIIGSAEPVGAWRDLPALQRTLADSLPPVAIANDFRDSLASYADPSLLAPLAHQVDPEAGGLVEGLVSPGVPYAHPGGPQLTVPPRPKTVVPRRAATSIGSGPLLQRTVIAPGPADLPTVPLELPEIELPTPESEPRSRKLVIAEPSEAARTPGLVTRKVAASQTSAVDHGTQVAAPATPARELPVVARSVDPSMAAEPPRLPRDSEHAVPSAPKLEPATSSTALPVVSPSVQPAAESAPLSGFAEVITRLTGAADVPVETSAADSSDDQIASAGDHRAAPSEPARSLPIQRLATEGSSAGNAEPLLVVQSAEAVHRRSSLPVVTRQTDAGAPSEKATQQGGTETRSDAPTLGVRLAQAPLTLQRALAERVSVPVEPPVQRLEFVAPQLARLSGATAQAASSAPKTAPTTAAPISATAAAPTHTVQRLPSQDGKQVQNPPARHSSAVSRLETQTLGSVDETLVQRGASSETVPNQGIAMPELTVRSEPAAPELRAPAEERPTPRAWPTTVDAAGGAPAGPAIPEVPTGPAVTPEQWAPVTQNASAAQGPAAPRHHDLLPTVSRLAADLPTRPTLRTTGARPTITIGPSIPQTGANTATSQPRSGGARSFTSMFDTSMLSTASNTETGSPAEDGFTSVQLQSAGESPAPAAEAAADTSSVAPSVTPSAPPAAAGAKPPDLDELARRLYEPLTARLRAELWLDRERAGVMSDA